MKNEDDWLHLIELIPTFVVKPYNKVIHLSWLIILLIPLLRNVWLITLLLLILDLKRVRAQTAQEDLEQLSRALDVLTSSWSFQEPLRVTYGLTILYVNYSCCNRRKSEAPAEDTPCIRTVGILRDLNNVPSRYCTFEFLVLWNDWLTLSSITLI